MPVIKNTYLWICLFWQISCNQSNGSYQNASYALECCQNCWFLKNT